MNEVKASVFRRWPVTAPYRGEQTTRLTGGHDFAINYLKYVWIANFGTEYNREQIPWAGGEYPAQAVQTF